MAEIIDLAEALTVDVRTPPEPRPVTFRVGDRVRVTIGQPGTWPRPGRITGLWEDPPRDGGIAYGVNFIEGRGDLYFAANQIEHID
ncbi:hypothetical protein SEA_GUDMIT_68 [Gordonia phage Gudmit]|nr:hypothetical protein SEA_GUDMIT_68 [Gordonia phage Gudmit]